MTVFVDTSALYALMDADDDAHDRAKAALRQIGETEDLITHAYVAVEALALVQRRLDARAVRRMATDLLPLMATLPVDESTHEAAVSALLAALPTRVSLVDLVSFQVMRDRSIARVFTFDADFEKAGFRTLP